MTQLRHIRIESLELDFNLHGCFQMYEKFKIKHQHIKKKNETRNCRSKCWKTCLKLFVHDLICVFTYNTHL